MIVRRYFPERIQQELYNQLILVEHLDIDLDKLKEFPKQSDRIRSNLSAREISTIEEEISS